MYEVYVEKAAENDLKRLTATTFHRIISQIRTLAENPKKRTGVRLGILRFAGSSIKKLAVSLKLKAESSRLKER